MPTVREIMMARSRETAKVHCMDRVPGGGSAADACDSPTGGGPTPMLVEHLKRNGNAALPPKSPSPAPNLQGPTPSSGPSCASRPPRPRPTASPGGGSNSGAAAYPRRNSEMRRPRPGSDPGRRLERNPSEPPARPRGGDDDALSLQRRPLLPGGSRAPRLGPRQQRLRALA